MAKKTAPLLPTTDELLRQFGDRLRMARLRRRLSAKQVAQRAGMAPMTLRGLERGGSGVTIGAYLAVMQVLGIETDLNLLGKADPVGRELQDAQLSAHTKATRSSMPPSAKRPVTIKTLAPVAGVAAQLRRAIESSRQEQLREAADRLDAPRQAIKKLLKPSEAARDWIKKSKFASAEGLAGLIDLRAPRKKRVR